MKAIQGLPELIVTLGRRRLSAAELAGMTRIQVRSALAQPTQCLAVWQVGDAGGSRRVEPAPGDSLKVELAGHRTPLFVGEVTVVEHGYGSGRLQEVRVRAYDALHRLRKRQHTRRHEAGNLAELAARLAEGTGLRIVGGGNRIGAVYQCARSDLDLLVEASARLGLYPVVDESTLRLVGLGGDGEPIELALGSTLHSAELEVSQEPSFRSAAVNAWNPDGAGTVSGSARSERARPSVRADPAPQGVGGGGLLQRSNETFDDGSIAAELAQADLDVRLAAEVGGMLVAAGNPAMQAGRRVQISGVARDFEGTYPICSALHTLSGDGYETTLSTLPPPPPRTRAADVTTLGVITDVEDPQQRGRVLVRLPAYPDLLTQWAPVLVMGAGANKGAVILPDTGDTVLVLLVAGSPEDAVVLGGLFGENQPPDASVPGERGSRYTVRTADGQELVLNGAAHGVRLSDGHGSLVEMGPDLLRITAATDLVLEAPGHAIRIRARAVDFEEAT